jgi:PAS domain S-box-containing protein
MEISSKSIWNDNQEEQLIKSLNSSALISITDSKGIIIYVNDAFCELSGYDEQELLGQNHRILKSGKHPDNIYKDLWETISSKRMWRGELCNKRKDGSFYWATVTIVPFTDKHGDIDKYLAIRFDITKNKENIEELNRAKNNFSSIFNSANDAILLVGIDTREIININNKATELLGYTKSALIGMSNYNLYPKKNIDFIKKQGEHMIANNYVIFETQLLHKDGSLIDVEIRSKVYNDGIQEVFQSVVRDITDKKRKELTIKSSEEKFKLFFNSAPDAYFISDMDGVIKNCNTAAEKLSGYTKKEIINGHISDTNFLSKTDMTFFVNSIKIPSKKHLKFEFQIISKQGKKIVVEIISYQTVIDDEKVMLNIAHDITERKTTNNELRKKTKDLELLLYRSGHDLRAPFTSLDGLIDLLKHEIKEESALELIGMVEKVLNDGKRLIDNLSASSLMLNNSSKKEQIDFNELVNHTLNNLNHIDGFKNISININIPKEFKFISNRQLLRSIIQNLLQNAIKYQRPFNTEHTPFIIINAFRYKDGIKISIKDNGNGIKKNELDKVFDLYYKSNTTVGGTGLGLYITKSAVEQLNGEISVTSILKKETQIDILLPNIYKA